LASSIEILPPAQKQFLKLGRPEAARILHYLETRVAPLDDPSQLGQALADNLAGLWRYRVGDYRVICRITVADNRVSTVTVVAVRHRREIYK
jgi:mRNA interferase RelE/StbE